MAVPRFSVSQVTTWNWPFERDVEAIAAAGAPAIAVSVRKLDAFGLAPARRLIEGAGLAVSCLTATGPFPLGDDAGERSALEVARRHLGAAAELGAACLMVVPGNHKDLSWEEAEARTRPLLEALLPAAAAAKVRLAVEPTSQLRMDLAFLHSFDEALDFVDEIASPWLGVVLELNNAWIERRLYGNIAARVDRIGVVQISDFRIGTVTSGARTMIGDGDIPLPRICAALAAADYGGWYDIELLGPEIEREGYAAVVPRAVGRFRSLWRHARP